MTGFGKGTERCPYGEITAEIKTLNHKSLSISCMPFEGFFLLEDRIKGLFNGRILRGKVFIRIARQNISHQKPLKKVIVNTDLAGEYLRKIKGLRKVLSVGGDIRINDVISFPGVVEHESEKIEAKLWPYIRKSVQKALDKLLKYRQEEGARLAKDIRQRLGRIEKALKDVRRFDKRSVEAYRKNLKRAAKEISDNARLDEGKLEEEVALFARNCDIAEEITRLDHHISVYRDSLKKAKGDVGKKLDFIAQEMHREANTISAKASDLGISKATIEIKSEIEKIREQVKNIE